MNEKLYWTRPKEELHRESLKLVPSAKRGIIPYVQEEVDHFKEVAAKFRAGEVDEQTFIPFRLLQGTYGQRQQDRQMFRVKIPGGILTPEALETLGIIAERYAPLKKGHFTTRENVQFHHMKLEDCAEAMPLLGDVGLSTREACGNTLRNVVGSPLAGVCPDEIFDVTPYLAAYVRYGVRHPLTQTFPRKFKTSFSGCADHDHVSSLLQDFAFIAQLKGNQRGFKIYVGGGTSIMPRYAQLLYEFVAVEDYLRVSQAVWTVFQNAVSLRKNRMMARIKVLIDKIGMDAFRKLVDEALRSIPPIDPAPLMNLDELYHETPPQPSLKNKAGTPPAEFQKWKKANTAAQKQNGYYAAVVKIPLGDVHAHQWKPLAGLVRQYTGGRAFATLEQNLTLRWIPETSLMDVWSALADIGFAEPGSNSITDVVACPATDSCKLGITSTMGLARALRESFHSSNGLLEDPLIKKMHIKMSGCPSGCSQHNIADIGFQGGAVKSSSGEQIPAYDILLGGHYGSGKPELMRFGTRLKVKVPAKRIPQFVQDALHYYQANRQEGEEFKDFVVRVGTAPFERVAAPLSEVGTLQPETLPFYTDWEKTVPYKVERGEGECAV